MRPMLQRLLTMVFALTIALVPLAPVRGQGEAHGVSPADMDRAADPRSDFYRYANGGWLDRTTIPADRSSYGVFTEVGDRNTKLLLDLLARLTADGTLREGTDEWKAVRFYAQGTDLAARNAGGVAPIAPTLATIDGITDLDALHRFLQTATFEGISGLLSIGSLADLKDSSINAAYLGGPSLQLPNRDYYLEESDENTRVQAAYIATSARLLAFIGYDAGRAERAARAVFDFERVLAEQTLTREQEQDFSLIYNPTPVAQLGLRYPLMDWPQYLDRLGIGGTPQVIVTETKYLNALDGIVRRTDLETIKEYLKLSLLWDASSNLSEEIETVAFEFGKVFGGQQQQQPIERRALGQVNGALGFAVGKLYVAETFPPEAKARITELVDEILIAFRARLENNAWMSPEAKAVALEKLANMRVKVGYPDVWRTYDAVEIGDSYAATALSAANAGVKRRLARVGKPVDRAEWGLLPQTINASYNLLNNDITFPAGILQSPFFDYEADPASNFGAIGYVIGHEITHAFDLRGSQFDPNGNLRSWWTDDDRVRFDALNKRVVGQFGVLEVLPGVKINGQITVTENVADLGGVRVAHDALLSHLRVKGDPGAIDGMTQEQRFFVAASTVWRSKIRDAALRTQAQTDEHSPAAIRSTQPLRNTDAFHTAFGIVPGDPMYLPPEERVVIW